MSSRKNNFCLICNKDIRNSKALKFCKDCRSEARRRLGLKHQKKNDFERTESWDEFSNEKKLELIKNKAEEFLHSNNLTIKKRKILMKKCKYCNKPLRKYNRFSICSDCQKDVKTTKNYEKVFKLKMKKLKEKLGS